MLREYLRHNVQFRAIFGPLIRRLTSLRFPDAALATQRYRDSVAGGTLILAPKNIPGYFEVSAKSDIAGRVVLSGCYEPEVTAVLAALEIKNGMIVNIGANVGFYAIFLARAFPSASRILAVEPNPEAYRQLRINIERNGFVDRIEHVQACIGESDGQIDLAVIDGMPEYSSINAISHPSVADKTQTSIRVKVMQLASLVGVNPVSLLFVDTEGAENLVFSGAREILHRDKPILFFECSNTLLRKFGSSTMELENGLTRMGYVVRNGLCRRLALRHPFEGEAIAIHQDDLKSQARMAPK